MIVHQSAIVDWDLIRSKKRNQQIKDHNRENRKQSNHIYKIREKALIITSTLDKQCKLMGYAHKGPYDITKFYTNGCVQIKCGSHLETINIRRLRPFYG